MDKEAFARYVAGLSEDLQMLATNIVRRIERLLNQDRVKLFDEIQTIERRLNTHLERIGEIDDRMRRGLAQQDDLLERVEVLEPKIEALARRMADLQQDALGASGGDG